MNESTTTPRVGLWLFLALTALGLGAAAWLIVGLLLRDTLG
jgi:hypothetical protein